MAKIFLDKNTVNLQTKILNNIGSNFLSKDRMPMLVIDSSKIFESKDHFSARGAAIIGFSMFSSNRIFLLNREDIDVLMYDFAKLREHIIADKIPI